MAKLVALWRIEPTRDLSGDDVERIEQLAASMRARGWQGRPLLLEEVEPNVFQAWTGTLRLAAAAEAGLIDVPAELVAVRRFVERDIEPAQANGASAPSFFACTENDDERFLALNTVGDLQGAQLMRAEIRAEGQPIAVLGAP